MLIRFHVYMAFNFVSVLLGIRLLSGPICLYWYSALVSSA